MFFERVILSVFLHKIRLILKTQRGESVKKYIVLAILTILMMFAQSALPRFIIPPAANVTTRALRRRDINMSVRASGRIDSLKIQLINPPFPLYLSEIAVTEGQQVSRGDVLFRVNTQKTVEHIRDTLWQSTMDMYGLLFDSIPVMAGIAGTLGGNDEFKDHLMLMSGGISEQDIPQKITAEFDGVVTSLDMSIQPGLFGAGVLAAVADTSEMIVRSSVSEKNISKIEVGQTVRISGDGFRGSVYDGTVKSIARVATTQFFGQGEPTVEVIISIYGARADLKPGLSANLEIYTHSYYDSFVIPYEAVRRDSAGREYVYVKHNGRARRMYIDGIADTETGVVINNPIPDGTLLILNADRELHDFIPVAVAGD
jgi:multidrug efflux pump subunit AcrA (membrane-fusion protein)